MNCNGDCFNCIYDDCIISDSHIKSLRLMDKKRPFIAGKNLASQKPAANKNMILQIKKGAK